MLRFWKNMDDDDKERLVKGTGLAVAVLTVFTLLATVSYLFTWKIDQSALAAPVSDKSVEISNIAGKLGYKWANLLVREWFGLGSLALILIMFAVSVRLLLGRWHYSMTRTILLTVSGALVASFILSFISDVAGWGNVFGGGLGGDCGESVVSWSRNLFGPVITVVLLLLLLALWLFFASDKFRLCLDSLTSAAGVDGVPDASLRSAPPLASQSEAPVPPLTVPRVAWVGLTNTPSGEMPSNDTSSANACEGGLPSGKESVEERIKRALVKGDASGLEADLLECLGQYAGEAFKVIDGPLMDGMARVGELFGAGKMFLPQVVKSARTMKTAVDLLQPHLKGNAAETSERPKVLLATVKGDVHDIGKNITGIVFTCNGFEVTDLEVMVPKETILEEAAKIGADIIGASGLITPSLYQMELLCKDMEESGMDTPLLVGGAAASAVHTAVKLAPLYKHVFYGADASASAVLASKLVSDREATEAAEHERQRALREAYETTGQRRARPENGDAAASTGPGSLRFAPYPGKCSPGPVLTAAFPAGSYIHGNPFKNISSRRLQVGEVERFFDWRMFATILGAREDKNRLEFMRLRAEGEKILSRLRSSDECRITISARFDLAHSEGDDIVSKDFRLPMFRQPFSDNEASRGRSLADFVAPSEYGFDSPMGMFAISVHSGSDAESGLDDSGMVRRAVILTLAEAASGWLDEYVKATCDAQFKVIKPAAGYSSCPDHTLKRDILRLLEDAGITLLDSCAMIPEAAICGLIFVHPEASYPEIRRLSSAEIDEYADRRGMSEAEKARFLGHLL